MHTEIYARIARQQRPGHNEKSGRTPAGEKKQAAKQETGSLEEQKQSSESDTIEQLQKYKGLLDAGVITEEEFAAKKKQLLGI